MTSMVAIVGGPLLIALADLVRRHHSRAQDIRDFPMPPVEAFAGGRNLVRYPGADVPVDDVPEVPEVDLRCAGQATTLDTPTSPPASVAGIEGVPRVLRIATPNLPLARPLPTPPPVARFLPYGEPRGFQIEPQ
jgi:hypothetical protein